MNFFPFYLENSFRGGTLRSLIRKHVHMWQLTKIWVLWICAPQVTAIHCIKRRQRSHHQQFAKSSTRLIEFNSKNEKNKNKNKIILIFIYFVVFNMEVQTCKWVEGKVFCQIQAFQPQTKECDSRCTQVSQTHFQEELGSWQHQVECPSDSISPFVLFSTSQQTSLAWIAYKERKPKKKQHT